MASYKGKNNDAEFEWKYAIMAVGMYPDRSILPYVLAITILLCLAAVGIYVGPTTIDQTSEVIRIVDSIIKIFLVIVALVIIWYGRKINFKQLLCRNHEFIQTNPPRPYGHGIDNPFMSENIGWGRAWVIPLKCKKCGWKHNAHRSSPSLLQRRLTFHWSASESNIKLAKQISKKLNALVPDELELVLEQLNDIELSCTVCDFKTLDADLYRNHIINEHLEVLQKDVLDTYLIKHNDVEIQYF